MKLYHIGEFSSKLILEITSKAFLRHNFFIIVNSVFRLNGLVCKQMDYANICLLKKNKENEREKKKEVKSKLRHLVSRRYCTHTTYLSHKMQSFVSFLFFFFCLLHIFQSRFCFYFHSYTFLVCVCLCRGNIRNT